MKTALPFRFILAFASLLVFLAAVTFIDTATAAGDGTRAKTIIHTPSDAVLGQSLSSASTATEYISPVFTAAFPFNGIGLIWSGPAAADIRFALSIDGGSWHTLVMTGDEAKDQAEAFTSLPLFIHGQKVQYKITGPESAAVQNVRLTYFDSTVPPQPTMLQSIKRTLKRSLHSASGVAIISRADWGADESYRTWEPQYHPVKKMIIHHTAGDDGGDDPAATIRGIYYWQAVVLGWGDIGYNYLVDQQGQVYEGRYGEASVIGAHAYNSQTDTNYNVGSIGIALLGCYESTDGACGVVATYSDAMHTSLTSLLGQLAQEHQIDPMGQKKWHGAQLPNITTHRDVDSTYCPGDLIYTNQLERIRQDAATNYALLQALQALPYQTKWLSNTIATSYTTLDEPTVAITYSNVGNQAWSPATVVLQLSIAETHVRQRVDLPATTAISQPVTFNPALTILPHHLGQYTVISKLYHAGRVIKGSTHRTAISLTSPYQATVTHFELPLAIRQGWIPTLTLTVQNSGANAWPAGIDLVVNQITLKTLTKPLAVGESRAISLPLALAADLAVGNQPIVVVFHSDNDTIPGSRSVQTLRVDP